MVVAAGTPHGEPEHRGADRRHDVVELAATCALELLLGQLGRERAGREESGGDPRGGDVGGELVAGDLPAEEGVEGEVVMEGGDNEVAVGVGMGPVVVLLVAEALGVPGDVEPVLGLTLAERRPGEEIVDRLRDHFFPAVVDEGPDLCRRRRQARQIGGESAAERAAVGHRARCEAGLPEAGEDEAVDRRAAPAIGIGGGGQGDGGERRERPSRARERIDRPLRPGAPVGRLDQRAVVGGTPIDPFGQPGQDVGRERIPLLRHVRLFELRGESVEKALRGPPRHDRRTAPPAGKERLPRGEIEAPFSARAVGAMASGAAVDEDVAEAYEELEATLINAGLGGADLGGAGARRHSRCGPHHEHDADHRRRQSQAVLKK